jgi:hypothetical protein
MASRVCGRYLQSRRLAEASGEKRIRKGPPNPTLPRSAAPCSPFSLARRHIDVPIAGEPSQDASNKSAKVVLGSGLNQVHQMRTAASMTAAAKLAASLS